MKNKKVDIFMVSCPECNKIFDMLDEDDVNEWTYGHDCEMGTDDESI